jgi:quercetin dioxygenase-like cupin family protein
MIRMPIDAIHTREYTDESTPHIRIRWTPESTDLHVNLVDLRVGEMIGSHVNASLDVVMTCLTGHGKLTIDRESIPMEAGSIALIPKGAQREIVAGDAGMRYTTCHQKRGGIMPTVGRRKTPRPATADRVSSPDDTE